MSSQNLPFVELLDGNVPGHRTIGCLLQIACGKKKQQLILMITQLHLILSHPSASAMVIEHSQNVRNLQYVKTFLL